MLDDLEVRGKLAGGHHAQGHSTGAQFEVSEVVSLGLNGCHCRQGSANEKRQFMETAMLPPPPSSPVPSPFCLLPLSLPDSSCLYQRHLYI